MYFSFLSKSFLLCSRRRVNHFAVQHFFKNRQINDFNLKFTSTTICLRFHSTVVETQQKSEKNSKEMLPEKTGSATETFERLPRVAKPINYLLHLKPFLDKFLFEGEETIEVEILKPTDFLKLYSSDLIIKDASLILKDTKESFPNLHIDFNTRRETATIKLPKELQPGIAFLKLKFEGQLDDKMKGFYRSKYKNTKGEDDYMATTQFESTSARKAFPCWDEPGYKATFDIALTVPETKTALSNMSDMTSEDAGNGWKKVTYARTPPMSTYLVAFIVGDFEYVEGVTETNTRVRVYTLPGKKYQGEFALQVAKKALPFFGNFFGIPYGLPKCDLVAVPDFNFGAMENWGLITYREVYLLLDPSKSSSSGKENIAIVVAHELAHMWFGNYTTMEWWTDLWLKEGYATWMEYYFVNDAFPEFDIFTQFLLSETIRSMSLDGLKNSHPVEVPINDPEEIEEIYDAVSYSKSASLIRMLHDFLGDEAFRKGLQVYLKKYLYKSTVTENLWECLTESSGRNVAQLMSNWTKCMGFPLIKVHTTVENGKVLLHLEQERFLVDGSKDPNDTMWYVPISIISKSTNFDKQKILLMKKSDSVVLDRTKPGDWIKLNAGFAAFYKVQYSDEMLSNLLDPISQKTLKSHDRLNICGDVFSLVRSGKLSATSFLDLLEKFENETDYTVWSDIDAGIEILDNCFRRTTAADDYHVFICKLYNNIAQQLGWEPKPKEGHTIAMLRPVVLRRLGNFGHQETIDTARRVFRAFVDHNKEIVPDLRSMVFALVGRYDGEKAHKELIQLYEKTDFSEHQRQFLLAIGRTTDVNLQKKCLEFAFSDKVRLQDIYLVFAGLSSTVTGQNTIWNYFKTNMETVVEKFGSPSNGLFAEILKMCSRYHCTEEKAKEVEEFFHSHPEILTSCNRPIQQSLENLRLNIALLKRDTESVKNWLGSK